MTRILMRAPRDPLASANCERVLLRDELNTNSGNLLFPYSISRALMTPGTSIDYFKNRPRLWNGARSAAHVNETYDVFVLPLANAFRSSFAPQLDILSDFIDSIDIPCVVIGVGLQAGVTADGSKGYRFDDSVRRFMRVALRKSDCVGVRGRTTGAYLERLGFVPERDFTVIGCPSLYLYGPGLPKPRPLELTPESRVSLNCKVTLSKKIHRYLRNLAQQIPDWHYVVQNTYEITALYYGLDLRDTHPKGKGVALPEGYPTGRGNSAIQDGRVVGFVDVPSWLAFLEGKDLNFGTRIHGSIAGVLAGVPTFTVVPDARVLELVEYHQIPHVKLKKLKGSRSVFELLEGVDFDMVLQGHEGRFGHYLDFLHRNGLRTVFDDGWNCQHELPFDIAEAGVRPCGPIGMKQSLTQIDKLKLRLMKVGC